MLHDGGFLFALHTFDEESSIHTGNALGLPSGNKHLTRANIDPDLCRHKQPLGHSELKSVLIFHQQDIKEQ